MERRVEPLTEKTWPGFADLVERHNGVFGGCWCMGFHSEGCHQTAAENEALKRSRVLEDRAHAALVFEGDTCVGWCQFGPTDELPKIKNRKVYEQTLETLPDWRITCFFVDRLHRKSGVASTALAGALTEIARLGGGTVESYPEDTAGRKTSAAFLHNGTLALFEAHGFRPARRIGKSRWVVTKTV